MYNLTQTTEHRNAQGRACPTTTSVRENLCRYVGATSLRLGHAPTHEASVSKRNTSVPCIFGGAGQRACTVPTSTPNTVIRISSRELFYHTARKNGNSAALAPNKERRFHPNPLERDGTSRTDG